MIPEKVQASIEQELAAAEIARLEGNEGKARVCARRAAGIAIQEFYRSIGEQIPVNVIHALQSLQSDPRVDAEWQTFAKLLLTHVTKDHNLPVQKDILAETRQFIIEIEESLRGNTVGK